MKKALSFFALCVYLCIVSCYDDAALWERIEALESTKIATINEQVAAIKVSIAELEAVDKELDAAIAALEKEDENLGADIDSLRAKGAALDERIDELKSYVEDELSATTDWANATFSTLVQYQATCDELAAIKVLIAELEVSLTQAISDAVAASETSIKNWVNEQLTGYWTIAETQARLDTIKSSASVEIAAIKADLNTAKEELTTAYQNEISKAISDSEGKLSKKIDEVNSALDKKIGAIESRLDAIEEKLDNIMREFAIVFDDTEIGIVPGGISSVNYTITGATETTTVKAFGQNGWSAKVLSAGVDKGTIVVEAPDPITDDEIIVLVCDGEFSSIMSTVNFVTGIATLSQKVVEFGSEADTVSIMLTSNLEYDFSIPYEAQSWLSVVEPATRFIKTDTLSFACAKYSEIGIRKASVIFYDVYGMPVDRITFVQINRPAGERIDVSYLLTNSTLRENSDGWDGTVPSLEYEVMEFYNMTFDMYQILTDIPNGYYGVKVQGFYRVGQNDGGSAYQNGTEKITAELYANESSVPLLSLYEHTASEMGVASAFDDGERYGDLFNGYVNMRVSTDMAFSSTNPATGGLYYTENELTVLVQDKELKIGLRNSDAQFESWCAFRDFKLYYYGEGIR